MEKANAGIKKIGLLANCKKPSAEKILRVLSEKARDLNLQIAVCDSAFKYLAEAQKLTPAAMADEIDLLVVLGGDGTMLRAVRLLDGRPIPVLGVNLGSLGFMTSVAEDRAEYALECVAEGRFSISRRALADCRVRRAGKEISSYRALNDIVIDRGASSRIVTLDLLMEDRDVSSNICDGMIVSTPTGSTGHSLSTGGPILHPETDAWVVSLISPHTLSARPLVIPNRHTVTVRVAECAHDLLFSVDGQVGESLKTGDEVRFSLCEHAAHFVQLPDYNYFAVLRQKLHWRGSNFSRVV